MDYYNNHRIKRQFSIARTPQQNGVVERKNRTVQEMARTMIMDSNMTDIFWTQEVHTTVHIQNRVMLRNNTNKTPYELVTHDFGHFGDIPTMLYSGSQQGLFA
jgi:transposase InsO family protein